MMEIVLDPTTIYNRTESLPNVRPTNEAQQNTAAQG